MFSHYLVGFDGIPRYTLAELECVKGPFAGPWGHVIPAAPGFYIVTFDCDAVATWTVPVIAWQHVPHGAEPISFEPINWDDPVTVLEWPDGRWSIPDCASFSEFEEVREYVTKEWQRIDAKGSAS